MARSRCHPSTGVSPQSTTHNSHLQRQRRHKQIQTDRIHSIHQDATSHFLDPSRTANFTATPIPATKGRIPIVLPLEYTRLQRTCVCKWQALRVYLSVGSSHPSTRSTPLRKKKNKPANFYGAKRTLYMIRILHTNNNRLHMPTFRTSGEIHFLAICTTVW